VEVAIYPERARDGAVRVHQPLRLPLGGVVVELPPGGICSVLGGRSHELIAALDCVEISHANSGVAVHLDATGRSGDAPPEPAALSVICCSSAGELLEARATLESARRAGTPVVALVEGMSALASALVIAEADLPTRMFLPAPGEAPSEPPTAPKGLEIRLLGPLEIPELDQRYLQRPKFVELVTYFAMHPRGVPTRVATAALWPDRRIPVQSVANRFYEARRALGFAPDGLPRFRREGDRHLLVDVHSDWERFRGLTQPGRDLESHVSALSLVRGRPFAELVEGQWALFEGVLAEVEQAVALAALRAGRWALERDAPDVASDLARAALRCAPFDERLHRLAMRAAHRAGSRSGVEEAMDHLRLLLVADGETDAAPHPETCALYLELTGREPAGHLPNPPRAELIS
jgi:DNA-binding SARP family transcriptional activator